MESLAKRKKIQLRLKYLTTPINIHEANLFLEWAIILSPELIFFEDANTPGHIQYNAPFDFWGKIFRRNGEEIKLVLLQNKNKLFDDNITVQFSKICIKILGLDENFTRFIENNKLSPKVGKYGV